MGALIKRAELDRLAEGYSLDPAGVEVMLEFAGARPSRADTASFLARCLRSAGVLSLASALVFFVAANWSALAIFGRFGLVELVLVACAALAYWKPPPRFVGRAALFLAFIATGALLALFGQTYQTGADVYELFLTWTVAGLPFVLLARWGVASAAWIVVFNTALLLFCGWHPRGGLLWMLFDGDRFTTMDAILGAGGLNIALWFLFERLRLAAVPEWVRRLVLACGFAFITWVGVLGVWGGDFIRFGEDADPVPVAGALLAMTIVGAYAWRRRGDIYPLALVMCSFIVVVMCWIPRLLEGADEAIFFFMALWLIATSTVGGRVLVGLMRRWRAAGPA